MNKRLLAIVIMGVFILTMVNAGLIVYYGQVTADIGVTQPITVTGNLAYVIEDAVSGGTFETGEGGIVISSIADYSINATISNDAPDGINVIYEYIVCPIEGYCSTSQILEGNIITIPEADNGSISLSISYELDTMLETGTYTITTTIDEFE